MIDVFAGKLKVNRRSGSPERAAATLDVSRRSALLLCGVEFPQALL